MPKRSDRRISKRSVDALAVYGRDAVFWDSELLGFGVRVYRSGLKFYIVQSRGPHGSRRVTLGRHGDLSADQARKMAAPVIDRIKTGEEPMPAPPEAEPTVADLAERYMRAHAMVTCKASTVAKYRLFLDKHILPALGEMGVGAVERGHAAALHYELRDRPISANEVIVILARMFRLAEAWGLRSSGTNPCRAVRKYKARKSERFLTREEIQRLGRVLDEAGADGTVWPQAVAALRLLMLTGCRRSEILTLRWDDVDWTAGELRLQDTKTGPRMVPLSPTVAGVLADIPRVPGNPWVIVGRKPGSPRQRNIDRQWQRLRARAGLDDVRIHDLRHTFASRALALGESLSMIGKLLGHANIQSTARYAHLSRDTERASVAKVGGSIGADIMPEDAEAA